MQPEKTPRQRAEDYIRVLVPDWRPTPQQGLWAIRISIVLGLLVAIGYSYGVTLWDWMKLLIVPAVIAAGGLWYNRQQQERQREDDRRQQKRGLEIEIQRARDEALQAYLDKMTDLLVVHKLSKPQDDKDKRQGETVRTVAWARTKTVLRRLDGNRKGAVLRFLNEAKLIERDRPVIDNLGGADLVYANLKGSVLRHPALQGVHLNGADLTGADLRGADLRGADLSGAKLSGAELIGADLTDAKVTEGQLDQAYSLEGATMPNGQKYEDWLKD